jgi:2-deoxy-D-gluconate 3-dehydrogenase
MILEKFSLVGRHIMVTGAGRGLGQSMAVAAAEAGAQVTAVARTPVQLEQTCSLAQGASGVVHTVPWDMARTEAVSELVDWAEENDPVDSVIHAAGVQLRKPAAELTPGEWREVQKVNAEAPLFLSTEIARRRLADPTPTGSHIFIGSLASTIGLPNVVPYVMSKSAVLGAVRALSGEWAARGIRVNGIAPGYVQTQLTADLLSRPADHARVLGRVPMGRLGATEDFAGAAVFLLSSASAYITGQMLNIDGGWLAA